MNELIGHSKHLQRIKKKVTELSKSIDPVVIIGEPGVGKSVIAEHIHEASVEREKPFVHLNLATANEVRLRALVQSLLERRLFINPSTSGHGNFQLPTGSTLIIEEVESCSPAARRAFLDLIKGLGRHRSGIRVIVLLTQPINRSRNKQDPFDSLWKSLERWDHIVVPPLRERQDDIPELIEHFVRQTAKEMNLGEIIVDINAVGVLVRREWKGNIRELKTFVEQAMMLSSDKETFSLPESLIDEQSELTRMILQIDKGIDFALDNSMELIERRILERVLNKFGFNQSRAARFLKITEDTLRYRMKKLGIPTSSSHETSHR